MDDLSFVLPVALDDTGRDGQDLRRLALLLESFMASFARDRIARFLIVTRPGDVRSVAACVAALGASFADVVDQTTICPALATEPQTLHSFPRPNVGWYRQQLIKLGAAAHLTSRFYMTLDADVIFARPFSPDDIVRNGKALANTQTPSDFVELFCDQPAHESVRVRVARDGRAQEILGVDRTHTCFYGETPVLLSREIVLALLAAIESRSGRGWTSHLLQSFPWTEYALYFTFAEASTLFDRYHERGDRDSVLRFSDSLWYSPEAYRVPRSLDNWQWTSSRRTDGVAVVVQSYLEYDVSTVKNKVRELRRQAE